MVQASSASLPLAHRSHETANVWFWLKRRFRIRWQRAEEDGERRNEKETIILSRKRARWCRTSACRWLAPSWTKLIQLICTESLSSGKGPKLCGSSWEPGSRRHAHTSRSSRSSMKTSVRTLMTDQNHNPSLILSVGCNVPRLWRSLEQTNRGVYLGDKYFKTSFLWNLFCCFFKTPGSFSK